MTLTLHLIPTYKNNPLSHTKSILQTVMNCAFLNSLTLVLSLRERTRVTKAAIRARVEYSIMFEIPHQAPLSQANNQTTK